MASRLDDLGALAAAHPLRHHDALGVHVLEAVPGHLGDRPLNRAIERRGAAEAVADRVGQHRQPIPGERAADGFANQARGRLAIRVDPGSAARGRGRWRLRTENGRSGDEKR
jgi:hypothetical protein